MINPDLPPFGGGAPFHILGMVVWAMVSFVSLIVLVAVLVLLVRYLLVATRSHQLYIANNTPAAPATAATPAEPVVVEKPVSRPRTPKAPPAV